MDADERELFASTVRDAVRSAPPARLDEVLGPVGWDDALEEDEEVAVRTWFAAQGEVGGTSGALGRVLLHALRGGGPIGWRGRGSAPLGVVLPTLGSSLPPGRVDGSCVPVDGLLVGPPTDAVVVVAGSLAGEVPTAHLDVVAVEGMDPALGLRRVTTACAPAPSGWSEIDGWDDAVAAGHRALGHELVGGSRTMLRLARDHALDRIQFGRPIAQFQAVRHRLAEAYAAVEAAEAALDAAWVDGSAWSAMIAKAVAGDSARTVRRHCQQVLAGIGFTTEHDLHRHVRRTLVLDGLLGDARTLTTRIGQTLLDARAVPPLTPL